MYRVELPKRTNTVEISFDHWECLNEQDPFFEIVAEYSRQYGALVEAVDIFYQYKLENDEFDLRFIWSATFSIYIFVPLSSDLPEIHRRIDLVCRSLNRELERQ